VRCDWRVDDGVLRLNIDVPPGVKALVTVPTPDPSRVTESGLPIADAPGVTPSPSGPAVFTIESGRYSFVAPATSVRP
jgi:alpha-L-rhamnosidase